LHIPIANQKTKLKINQFASHSQGLKKINFGEVVEIQNLEKQSFLLGSCCNQNFRLDFSLNDRDDVNEIRKINSSKETIKELTRRKPLF
jgi:hypothetical protein